MNKIKTLLVDDEYLALNLLEGFVAQLTMLEIVGKVKSPVQAMEILQKENVELLFLDIQMPTINGNQFLRSLKNPPATIFTTAYSEYAVDAFNLGAVDYLVKPFSFDRFFQATQKALEVIRHKKKESTISIDQDLSLPNQFLSVKADGKIYRIALAEILYIEGLKEYVKIVTEPKTYITLETFKNLETILPSNQFLRVHKSFMVAKDKVRAIDGNILEVGKATIPISRERKEELVKLIFGR
ncbi:MAG: LytR/AlgR family response regulator transcription factor [Cyclobacteriaceae bacterium]